LFVGVHSSLNLDQLAPGTPITPIPTVPTLPTIAEVKVVEPSGSSGSPSPGESQNEIKHPRLLELKNNVNNENQKDPKLPRNASQPAFSSQIPGILLSLTVERDVEFGWFRFT